MHAPPVGMDQRQVQELHNRFSKLSADLSACLDAVLLEVERAPDNVRAVRLARDLASAQYAVTQQLMRLPQLQGLPLMQALPPPQAAAPYPAVNSAPVWPNAGAALNQGLSLANTRSHYDLAAPTRGQSDLTQSLGDLLRQRLETDAAPPGQPTYQGWHPAPPQPGYQTMLASPPQPRVALRSDHSAPQPPVLELSPSSLINSQDMIWTSPNEQQLLPVPAPVVHAAPYVEPAPASSPPPRPAARSSAPPPSDNKAALPAWLAPASARASRFSSTRAAVAMLAVLGTLILMLHAAQRSQTPAPDTAQAPAVQEVPGHKLMGQVPPAEAPSTTSASAHESEPHAGDAQAAPAPTLPEGESGLPAVTSAFASNLDRNSRARSDSAVGDAMGKPAPMPAAAPTTQVPPPTVVASIAPVAAANVKEGAPKAQPNKRTAKVLPDDAASVSPPPPKQGPAAAGAPVAPFKTAVVKVEPKEKFAPVLLELKSGDSLLRIFQDLQQRHASTLGGKRAELRPVAGPNNEKWMALLAVPATARDQAEAVCRDLGAEGQALGCRVTSY